MRIPFTQFSIHSSGPGYLSALADKIRHFSARSTRRQKVGALLSVWLGGSFIVAAALVTGIEWGRIKSGAELEELEENTRSVERLRSDIRVLQDFDDYSNNHPINQGRLTRLITGETPEETGFLSEHFDIVRACRKALRLEKPEEGLSFKWAEIKRFRVCLADQIDTRSFDGP